MSATVNAAPGDEYWDTGFALSGLDDSVQLVVIDSQDNIYVAGGFSYADGLEVNGLAHWNGNSWADLGVSSGDIQSIAIGPNDALYASGSFSANNSYLSFAMWDGTNWTDLSAGLPGNGRFYEMTVANNGTLYAAGYRNVNNVTQYGVYSLSGGIWSPVGEEFSAGSGFSVSFADIELDGNGNLIVAGTFGVIGTSVVNSVALWDGVAWTALSSGVTSDWGTGPKPGIVRSIAFDSGGDLYLSGYFEEAGGNAVSGTRLVKWSGGAWSQPFSGANDELFNVSALSFDSSDNLHVASSNPGVSGFVHSWNGTQWILVGLPFNARFHASPIELLEFDGNGSLYAAGPGLSGLSNGVDFNGIARYASGIWSALGSHSGSGANGTILSMAKSSNGTVYASGRFVSIGGKMINHVAQWDGSVWTALSGGGVDINFVSSLAVASNGDVYAGGQFTDTATYNGGSVARWDGSGWTLIGSDNDGDINDLAIGGDGSVYAAGPQYLNNTQINNIAIWDGSSWSELNGGVSNPAGSVAVNGLEITSSGDLIVAGQFTQAGNVAALDIARWDGNVWSAMGAGLDSDGVLDIVETPSGGIAAVGNFTVNTSTGETAPLAVWNGISWNYINGPGGLYETGLAVAIDAQDNIVVGGDIRTSPTSLSRGIAAWDGTQWKGYGSGFSNRYGYRTLLPLDDGSVLIGGDFKEAGGIASSRIARWAEPVAPEAVTCNGLPVTVDISLGQTGTSGDDVILGTAAGETISGFGGDDTICGMGGDDIILAGNGDDWVDAGAGDDEVQGSNGVDTILGGEGDDYLAGGPGDDVVHGYLGDDTLYGNKGNDVLSGGEGVDDIRGGAGDDNIDTGSGATVGNAAIVDGGAGNDRIDGGPDADEIRGSTDQDIIAGGGGDDQLYGGSGEDQISGEDGDDLIRGNAGNDTLLGGMGDDNINGFGSRDTIRGGSGDDILDGSTGNDVIEGKDGNDIIRGGGGNDRLYGDAGSDSIQGGGGDDLMDGGSDAADTCDGQGGVDTASASCEVIANTP